MSAQSFPSLQPTEAHRLLRMRDLIEMTALSRATIYRAMEAGAFPLPIRIGGNNRWRIAEIIDFIEGRAAFRDRCGA
jgi:prophage regulatory protein